LGHLVRQLWLMDDLKTLVSLFLSPSKVVDSFVLFVYSIVGLATFRVPSVIIHKHAKLLYIYIYIYIRCKNFNRNYLKGVRFSTETLVSRSVSILPQRCFLQQKSQMESNNQIRKKWCVYKHSDEKKTEEKRQKPSQLALLVSYSHSLGFANTMRCQQMYFGSDIRWFIIKSSKNKVATIIKEKKNKEICGTWN
jgi:hypothetical protein